MTQEIIVKDDPIKPMSAAEEIRLKQLQEIVVVNFQAFVKVGQALAEIRERQLYRIDYRTFEEYVKKVFDIARSRAYQYIEAADVVSNLEGSVHHGGQNEILNLLPINERQVRPLTKLQPEQQKAVWQAVVDNSGPACKVTASLVNKVVKEYLGEKVKSTVRTAQARVGKDQHISAEFKEAFGAFMDQLINEKEANYKTTSRPMIVKYLDALRQVVAEDGGKIEEHSFIGTGGDANKLLRAGYRLFRLDRASKRITELTENGGWKKHSGPFETLKEMDAEFSVIMQDEKFLRG